MASPACARANEICAAYVTRHTMPRQHDASHVWPCSACSAARRCLAPLLSGWTALARQIQRSRAGGGARVWRPATLTCLVPCLPDSPVLEAPPSA